VKEAVIMTREEACQIAMTSIDHLGGYKALKVMVNARNFSYSDDGALSFRISGNKEMNFVRIKVNANDLYDLEGLYATAKGIKVVAEETDIFCEDLRDAFERLTGLCLIVPNIIFS
jgi:hypothetical protein